MSRAREARLAQDDWRFSGTSLSSMRVFLVGGCHPVGQPARWKLASNTFGVTTSLRQATLFPFNAEWCDVAFGAARAVKDMLPKGAWTAFTARVLVAGDPESPTAVIPCWKVEGRPEPQAVSYPFDPPPGE
jgi:hypothetical protein